MVSAMYADGEVDAKEMEVLSTFAKARRISEEKLSSIIRTVSSGQETLPVPQNQKEAREIISAMARVVLADGRLSNAEKNLLQKFGESQGLVWADIKLIIAQQKARLYSAAKRIIKEAK